MMPCMQKICFGNAVTVAAVGSAARAAPFSIALRCNHRVVVDTLHGARPLGGAASTSSRGSRSIGASRPESLPRFCPVRSQAGARLRLASLHLPPAQLQKKASSGDERRDRVVLGLAFTAL